jgi:quercetin dioxygenase-like cupin family protein
MVQVGDTLHNPETGETFVILNTAAETDGRLFRMESRIEPHRGTHVPAHYHPAHTMRLSIKQGAMVLWMETQDSERLYEAGAEVVVPIDVPYNWRVTGDRELRFITEFQPAGEWDKLFESMCAIGRAASRKELNSALASACVLNNVRDHMYFAGLPEWLQKATFRIIASLAGIIGYRGYYAY